MEFINLNNEGYIFKDDRTTLDVSRSFVTDEQVDFQIEIKPDSDSTFIKPIDGVLNWIYNTSGEKTVTVKMTVDYEEEKVIEKEFTLNVLDASSLSLFSTDDDLSLHELNLFEHLPITISSFNSFHYRAQLTILKWLDQKRIYGLDGAKIEAGHIKDISEVRDLSVFWALHYFFFTISNRVDDLFKNKADHYLKMAREKELEAYIRLAPSASQDASTIDVNAARLVRR